MTNNRVTIKDVYELIEKLREDIEEHYVTQKEFKPVRLVVFGLVGLIMASVVTALVAQVVIAFL